MKRLVLLMIAGCWSVSTVYAQGLSIHSHSACALGRNSAGVADPCSDGSTIFYNPAAIATHPGVISAGVLAIKTDGEFRFDGSDEVFESTQSIEPVPHAWLTSHVHRNVALGVGVWAPYGLTTEWPLAFEGRFTGYRNTLRAIYIQPTAAVRLMRGRLALGGGLDIVNGMVEINRRVDLARTNIPGTNVPFSAIGVADGTDFADTNLKVDDWAFTFNVGAQYQASDRFALGLRYLHSARLGLSGDAKFEQVATGFLLPAGNPLGLPAGTPLDAVLATQFDDGAALSDQALETEIELPSQIVAGVRFTASPYIKLLLEYQWTNWEKFDQAALDLETAPDDTLFLDFEDASTVRFAAEYAGRSNWSARASASYNTAATPAFGVTPLLPEADRVSFAGGLGYQFSRRFRADGGFEVVLQDSRRGSVRPRESRDVTPAEVNVGRYQAGALFGGITLSYTLGPTRDDRAGMRVRR